MTRPTISLVLVLLASVPIMAASADLHVVVTAPFEVPVGDVSWLVRVVNVGPDAATDIRFTSGLYRGSLPAGEECEGSIPDLAPGAQHEVSCSGTTAAIFPYNWTIRARVESATPDPVIFDNEYGIQIRVLTDPDLVVFASTDLVDPGLPFDLNVRIANFAYTEATGALLRVNAPRVTGFPDLPESCAMISETAVHCDLGDVPAAGDGPSPWWGEKTFTLRLIAPDDPSGASLAITAGIEADQEDPQPANNTQELSARMYRTFWVTSTADTGEGSLRSAIETASSSCGPEDLCKIAFRIPNGSDPWKTIILQSPLPALRGVSARIDGTTQSRFFGDSNPTGPEVEVSGREITGPADGFVLQTTCSSELTGLTINGFDGAGVIGTGTWECEDPPAIPVHSIRDSFIGTDPTGLVAVPNVRGIIVDFPRLVYEISGNLVSGNERSGITSVSGARRIANNIIGMNRTLSADLGNGASGIYIAPDSDGTDVTDNYIGFNRHFGIAIASDANWVAINGNSIQANWQGGIDIGLDGLTPVLGPFSNQPEDVLKLPVITSAFLDEVRGVTVIEGLLANPPRTIGRNTINIYASDAPDPNGHGEGQYFLGEVPLHEDGSFHHEVEPDLRGKWISATVTRRHYVGFAKPPAGRSFDQGFTSVTSEFGLATEVQ